MFNFNGAGEYHLEDATFVDAAEDWHEAKLLAEGGLKGSQEQSLEQRYESSKLFG